MTDPWDVPRAERPQQQSPTSVVQQQVALGAALPQRKNTVAVVGAITSFIPVIGLALSVVGRIRARALGGAGSSAATTGIVLSVVFTVGFGFIAYEMAYSSPVDPGCIAYEQGGLTTSSTLMKDAESLNAANASGDAATKAVAQQKFLADIKSAETAMEDAEGAAQDANVRAGIAKIAGDLHLLYGQYTQYIAGSGSAASIGTIAGDMAVDGRAIASLCGDPTDS